MTRHCGVPDHAHSDLQPNRPETAPSRLKPHHTTRRLRRGALIGAAAAIAAGLLAGPVTGAVPTPSAVVKAAPAAAAPVYDTSTLDPTSRDSVRNAYQNWFLPALDVPTGWNGDTATCAPAGFSSDAHEAMLQAVNYLRAMAGAPALTENTSGAATEQATALLMSANGQLSHTPPPSWRCYGAAAAAAASTSTLSLASQPDNAAAGILIQATDLGSANVSVVGHRRWLLDPALAQVSLGATDRAQAVGVMGQATATPAGDWIAYPSAGYFPAELLDSPVKAAPSATDNVSWSLSYPGADFSGATVRVTNMANGQLVPVTQYPTGVSDVKIGVNSLVWSLDATTVTNALNGLAYGDGSEADFKVEVAGIQGASSPTHAYVVQLFRAAGDPPSAGSLYYTASPDPNAVNVGTTLTFNPSGCTTAQDVTCAFQWLRGQDIIPGATSASYQVAASDAGQCVRAWIRVSQPAHRTLDTYTSCFDIPAAPGTVGPGQSGTAQNAPSGVVTGQAPRIHITVKIKGSARAGHKLKAVVKTKPAKSVKKTYRWYRAGKKIKGATHSTYKVKSRDRGHKLKVKVTAKRAGYRTATKTSKSVKIKR
ncbi:MAG: CAP domain-containing protein [Bifidobacteriaceae bacterium]|jgi:uncharacterized protein YkwD|nr:CAP domain-containing protein [Bifidobacteriaceae bacterium]